MVRWGVAVVTGGSGVNGGFFFILVVRVDFSGCSGGFLWLFGWISLVVRVDTFEMSSGRGGERSGWSWCSKCCGEQAFLLLLCCC
jgi:hypothetical protein